MDKQQFISGLVLTIFGVVIIAAGIISNSSWQIFVFSGLLTLAGIFSVFNSIFNSNK